MRLKRVESDWEGMINKSITRNIRSVGLRRTLGLGKIEGRPFSEVRKLVILWEEIKDEEEIEANCYAINKRDTFVNSNELEFLRHENEELKKSLSEGQYTKTGNADALSRLRCDADVNIKVLSSMVYTLPILTKEEFISE